MLHLDTHILLWMTTGSDRLTKKSRTLITTAVSQGNCGFSAFCIWEIAMLVRKKRYHMELPLEHWRKTLKQYGLLEVPVDGLISIRSQVLKMHNDPADRIIAATAIQVEAQLMTSDIKLLNLAGLNTVSV